MFENGLRPALAIPPILLAQFGECRSHHVVQTDRGIEPDFAAGQTDPVVKFRVFVRNEPGVIAANLAPDIQPEPGVVAMINIARLGTTPVSRSAGTHFGFHGPGRAPLKTAWSHRIHDRGQRCNVVFNQAVSHGEHIARWVIGMRIHAHQNFMLRFSAFIHHEVHSR